MKQTYQVGVVRFQDDVTEMFLVVVQLSRTYCWRTTTFCWAYVTYSVIRGVQLNWKIDYRNESATVIMRPATRLRLHCYKPLSNCAARPWSENLQR